MNLEAARVIWKYRRPHELEILNYHKVRGGERHGKTVVALKGPPWSLPHALSRILVEGTKEERQMASEAVRDLATEIKPFDFIWY